jgi:Na+-driven multidrug efflux pump
MTINEILTTLRVGLSLVVGFIAGKTLATTLQHHASEFFIGGFMLGVLFTWVVYWGIDALIGDRDSKTGGGL